MRPASSYRGERRKHIWPSPWRAKGNLLRLKKGQIIHKSLVSFMQRSVKV